MSQPQNFNDRYEQMRGSAAPPPASVEVAEQPVVVDLPDGKPTSEEAKPAASEKPQAAKATPAPAAPAAAPAPAPAGPKKKTVEELEQENQELQRQLAARPAPVSPPESKPAPAPIAQPAAADDEPKPDKYPNGEWDPKYIEDHTRWTYRDEHRKRLEADRVQTARAELKTKFDAAATKHADFHEVAQRPIPTSETMLKAIQASEHSGELFYYLGTHEAEAREIAALPEAQAWRKLIAIESQFTTSAPVSGAAPAAGASAPPATIVQSRAPKPPTTVRPSSMPHAVTLEDINKMPPGPARQKAFVELRAQQGQKDAKRLVATS